MLREAINNVDIEGILSEINIEDKSYIKDGATKEAVAGYIKVKVNQKINGETKELEIPVHVFCQKLTNSGAVNPSYVSIDKFRNNAVSIAAAGGVDGADWVQVRGAKITMNEYYRGEELRAQPRVNASFLNKIPQKDMSQSKATFTMELMVTKKERETVKGEETGRYRIKAAVPRYGGKVDLIPLLAESPGVIDALESYWEEGQCYSAVGRLNFSSKTEVTYTKPDFGEDTIKNERTVSVSELIITGGSQAPMEEGKGFDIKDIKEALSERQARLEELKEKSKQPKAAPKAVGSFSDLGF